VFERNVEGKIGMGYFKQKTAGKLPTISLEVKPLPDGDRHATFKETFDTFLEAWEIFCSEGKYV